MGSVARFLHGLAQTPRARTTSLERPGPSWGVQNETPLLIGDAETRGGIPRLHEERPETSRQKREKR